MIDAHFHRQGETIAVLNDKEFYFCGIHPWDAEGIDIIAEIKRFRSMLDANTSMGVGEIGLDRLKGKVISQAQKEVFVAQLELAAEMSRPVVLHGAKCWGEVVKSIRQYVEKIPAFLFHGFSRSDGLIPDIVAVNGFIGVGKSILNDHAINYRNLLKKVPKDRLLIETDSIDSSDEERSTVLSQILAKTYEVTSVTELQIKANTELFLKSVT